MSVGEFSKHFSGKEFKTVKGITTLEKENIKEMALENYIKYFAGFSFYFGTEVKNFTV